MRTKKNNFLPKINKTNTSSRDVEAYLLDLEKANNDEISFWEDYWVYLSREREKKLDDISDSLIAAKFNEESFEGCSRIVSEEFSHDPLCTVGSALIPSNRFNFGNISTSIRPFQALYVGENFGTAYFEKYGQESGVGLGVKGYDSSILRAQPGHFAHFEVEVFLESFIDLRNAASLQPFVDVIKEIQVPASFEARAKKLFNRHINFKTINNVASLKKALLYREHAQWPAMLDQPSNSQWFGHYVKEAGISGIVYPSVRSKFGFNIVLFSENLKDSKSFARLAKRSGKIQSDRQRIDEANYKIMQFAATFGSNN